MLPLYADVIADARQRGERPDSVVFISLGKLGVRAVYPGNWRVVVTPRAPIGKLDFSWCIGLDIEVVAERVYKNPRCIAVCEAILANTRGIWCCGRCRRVGGGGYRMNADLGRSRFS